jgi:hypothetical protein
MALAATALAATAFGIMCGRKAHAEAGMVGCPSHKFRPAQKSYDFRLMTEIIT